MAGFIPWRRLLGDVEHIRLAADGHRIDLLGACEGLEGEAQRIREALREMDPDTVALGLDPDLAPRVQDLAPGNDLSVEDTAYRLGLGRWGEVTLPPPEYPAAIEVADEIGATVEGVDMPEEEYLNRFTAEIGVLDLAKRALRVRWMKTRPPKAKTPADYCRVFDDRVNKGPFQGIEKAREARIAQRLTELAAEGAVACVLEVQRLDGVARVLQASPTPRT